MEYYESLNKLKFDFLFIYVLFTCRARLQTVNFDFHIINYYTFLLSGKLSSLKIEMYN